MCSWIPKGIKATNNCQVCFFCMNFNMPISSLWSGSSTFASGFMSNRYGDLGGGTQDLGWLYPGYEIATADAMYRYCVTDGSCLNGIARQRLKWLRAGTCYVDFCQNICVNIQAPGSGWTTQYWETMYMTGMDTDEVCTTATYGTAVHADCVSGDNVSIGGCSLGVCFCNVRPTTKCDTALMGSIWVEGNNLNFINAQCWEHTMAGDCQGSGGTAGAIWIDTNHYLNWVNSGGVIYRAKWRICQFCSDWTNSSGPNPSPGAGYKGAIWMDEEFGLTHLAYIGCDGHKYLTGAGIYPYTAG